MTPGDLIEQFQSKNLKQENWTHEAHLWVALHYLELWGPEKSLFRLREDIQQLNLAHGVFTTKSMGYHETRTRVWLSVLWKALQVPLQQEQLVSEFRVRDVALDFYEPDTLKSWQARTDWVAPEKGHLDPDPGLWGDTPPLISLETEF